VRLLGITGIKIKKALMKFLLQKFLDTLASPAKVAAQTVTPNSEDLVFNVTYTKNSQTHPTIPENKPNKPQEENVLSKKLRLKINSFTNMDIRNVQMVV
jgi:hypothetical protein